MIRTALTCLLCCCALTACVDTAGGGGGRDDAESDTQPRDARPAPEGADAAADAAPDDMAAEADLSPTTDMGLEPDLAIEPDLAFEPDMAPDAGPPLCQPRPERCDGLDDDCDGRIDEGYADLGQVCAVGVGLCRAAGVMACTEDGAGTACDAVLGEPADELCNGADDDCDGATDEGLGVGEACAAGIGACEAIGAQSCGPDGAVLCDAAPGAPGAEQCNGLDDDCDGATDEITDGVDPCAGQCGDGLIDEGEECDDGNRVDGDGCSAQCTLIEVFRCPDGSVSALQNPGFESGAVEPWVGNGPIAIVPDAHGGAWAAQVEGNRHVEQIFDPPVPIADLLSARFWTHHPVGENAPMSIEWTYEGGGRGSTFANQLNGWVMSDILANLDPALSLASLRAWGYSGGGAAADITRFDDFEFCVAAP